ncbi:MAG: Fic/DOC family protein [Sphingobacteriia bacterium]|nr:Fic/DOC family protein [Sphingobacteriia bacterium]
MNTSAIQIFTTKDGKTEIEVKLDQETVWLSLNHMVELFERDKSVISRHINNIFKENELEKNSVVAKIATTASDGKNYQVDYYNLDVIISVGYRVKSKRGTQFRIWANKVLKDYLVQGYSINEKRLQHKTEQLEELRKSVKLLSQVMNYKTLTNDESYGLLKIISDYAYALDILDRYDFQTLEINETSEKEIYRLGYEEAIRQIQLVKQKFGYGDLFGREKDKSFLSSVSTIYQTFDGKDLYPSIEEKASNLLYLITKNHSFSDGNKRIAAFLFLYFLERNGILYTQNGEKRIADNALVALTLMIAVSKTEEKDTITKIVVNLINKNNDGK